VALLAVFPLLCPAQSVLTPPIYSRESITNSATSQPNRLSPYTLLTIYGKDLSNVSWQASVNELALQRLPLTLPGGNLMVRLGAVVLPLLYVAPTQINCLIPAQLRPGVFELRIIRSGVSGPAALIEVMPESPELFRVDLQWAAATHADGRVLNEASPAKPGEVIVLYGTGFGPAELLIIDGAFVQSPAALQRRDSFRVRLNQEPLPADSVLYVGLTPGFAGLYQVNVRLPETLPNHPQVEVGWEGNWSALGPRIPATFP
jgi:uncharacterized protein (TIGR03437 family)